MTNDQCSIVLFHFFIFLIMGIPIGICLGLSSVCAILYSGTSLTIVATNMYSGISKVFAACYSVFRIIQQHYGEGRHFQTPDRSLTPVSDTEEAASPSCALS